MKLYFDNGVFERLIASPTSKRQCDKEIKKFLEDRNYKSYYSRYCMMEDGRICIDVGCHTQFFYVKGARPEDFYLPVKKEGDTLGSV